MIPSCSTTGQTLRLPVLRPGEVDIWLADVDAARGQMERFHPLLSLEEKARSLGFRFDADRDRYILAHGILRSMLEGYGCGKAALLRFGHGPHGKPFLMDGDRPSPVSFSIARSGGIALLAFSRDREIGVDLEEVDARIEWRGVAAAFFSPQTVARLLSLPAVAGRDAFFREWACLEAEAKARGIGITPLERVHASMAEQRGGTDPPAPIRSEASPFWRVQPFTPLPGYAAAIAAREHGWRYVLREYAGGG